MGLSNLPPGCTVGDIERHFAEGPCAVCGKPADDCCCLECPKCGEQGNPRCYAVDGDERHGLRLSRDQAIGRVNYRIAQLSEQLTTEAQYAAYLQSGGEFSGDIGEWKNDGL